MAHAKYIFMLKILVYLKLTQSNMIITKSMIRYPGDEQKINKNSIVKNRTEGGGLYPIVLPYDSTKGYLNDSTVYREGRAFDERIYDKEVVDTITVDEKSNAQNITTLLETTDVNTKFNKSVINSNDTFNRTPGDVDFSLDGSVATKHEENENMERVRQQRSSFIGLNNKYWDDLRRMSYNYLQNSHSSAADNTSTLPERNEDVDSTKLNLWEPLFSLYYCFWSDGIMKCIKEYLLEPLIISPREETEYQESLLNLMSDGDSEEAADDRRPGDFDKTEGRKKLTNKLLLPLLLLIKALVLPSLAGIALVTGKAFFLSMFSLLVTAFAAATARYPLHFRDSLKKRHEIETPPYENGQHYFM